MLEAVTNSITNLQGTDLLIALFLIAIIVTLRVPEANLTKKTRAKVLAWLMIAMGCSVSVSVLLRIFF